MYDPILVALDGSRRAERVLPHAEALAALFSAHLILLQATDPPNGTFLSPGDGLRAGDRDQREASSYLARMQAALERRGIAAQVQTPPTPAAEAIVEYAVEASAGLIAITTRGHGGLGRLLFGSVATVVARTAPCPVFVVRPTARHTSDPGLVRRILVLVREGDTVDAGATAHAVVFAERSAAALTLLQATLPVSALRAGSGPGGHPRVLAARARLDAAVGVAELAQHLRARGLEVDHEALGGDTAAVALKRARQLRVDLVVVPAAGPGSVAEEVARRAPCPVLIADAHRAPSAGTHADAG
jgi:nucleotide-binding universal stress UspA family protein